MLDELFIQISIYLAGGFYFCIYVHCLLIKCQGPDTCICAFSDEEATGQFWTKLPVS